MDQSINVLLAIDKAHTVPHFPTFMTFTTTIISHTFQYKIVFKISGHLSKKSDIGLMARRKQDHCIHTLITLL